MGARLVVVVGSTAVGKTKLSLDLAERFDGEIVSADSMQIYRDFDVGSAKATPAEQQRVRHHLLSVADVTDATFNVARWADLARAAVADIVARGKLPIVVGGSHFYVQALLHPPARPPPAGAAAVDVGALDDAAAYELLCRLDPVAAARWHPNDVRKIRTALQRALQSSNSSASSSSSSSNSSASSSSSNQENEFDYLLIWLTASEAVMTARIERRIAAMVEDGELRREIDMIDGRYREQCDDYVQSLASGCLPAVGVFQAIGVKEFAAYLQLTPQQRRDEPAVAAARFEQCLALLSVSTRRYARHQAKHLAKYLLPRFAPRAVVRIDTSNAESHWTADVLDPCVDHVRRFLSEPPSSTPSSSLLPSPVAVPRSRCDACDLLLVGQSQTDAHFNSARHRKRLRAVRKRQENNDLCRRQRRQDSACIEMK